MPDQRLPHVMLDLETWATSPNALVISIGAVKFDPATFETVDQFYVGINPADAQRYGLDIEASTVKWWFEDEQAAARNFWLSSEHHDVGTALDGFQMWYGFEELPVWGNGAAFDNEILKNLYKKASVEAPWRFWSDRCFRTMKNLSGAPDRPEWPEGLTKHVPVDDAIAQVQHLKLITENLGSMWV